jgi:hypothetical protein
VFRDRPPVGPSRDTSRRPIPIRACGSPAKCQPSGPAKCQPSARRMFGHSWLRQTTRKCSAGTYSAPTQLSLANGEELESLSLASALGKLVRSCSRGNCMRWDQHFEPTTLDCCSPSSRWHLYRTSTAPLPSPRPEAKPLGLSTPEPEIRVPAPALCPTGHRSVPTHTRRVRLRPTRRPLPRSYSLRSPRPSPDRPGRSPARRRPQSSTSQRGATSPTHRLASLLSADHR